MKTIKFWCLILALLSFAVMLFACDALGKTDETDNTGSSDVPGGYPSGTVIVDGIYYMPVVNGEVNAEGKEYAVAFADPNIEEVIIKSEINGMPVTEILGGAFCGAINFETNEMEYLEKLKKVSIPASVTHIGSYAFSNCMNLESVIFEKGSRLESIGQSAFAYCTSLESITIPSRVISIGADITVSEVPSALTGQTFLGCTSLKNVIFEDNSRLETIGQGTFADCTSLESITIPKSVKRLCGLDSDYVTYSTNSNETSTGIRVKGGVFEDCTSLKSVVFEKGSQLESIGPDAFANCTSLESITIPASVTEIGVSKKIGLGGNMTMQLLKGGTFSGCTSLKSVEFEENSLLKTIGDHVFENCTSLISITIPGENTKIGKSAFKGCINLENITFISDSVTSIGDFAFSGCTDLMCIIFDGTKEEWQGIKKAAGWDKDTGNYTVRCTDGELEKE